MNLNNMVLNYVLIGAIASISLLMYWFWTRRKKQVTEEVAVETKDKGIDQFVEVEARVYDCGIRSVYNTTITADIVRAIRREYGNLGRKWNKDGKWLYALVKSDAGVYSPVTVPQTLADPPSELHRALMQQEIDIVYNVQPEGNIFQKYGWAILITIVVLVILFLMVMQAMQK